MTCVVDIFEVQGDHVRPILERHAEPREYLIDTRVVRNRGIEAIPIRRLDTFHGRLRTDEKEGSRDHALQLRGDPDRLTPVEAALLDGRSIPDAVPRL